MFGYVNDLNVKSGAASRLSIPQSGSYASREPKRLHLIHAWFSLEYLSNGFCMSDCLPF